jgi:hypothetical protein
MVVAMSLGLLTVNTDDEISRFFTELPCLSCGDWRSDRVKAAMGRIYSPSAGH